MAVLTACACGAPFGADDVFCARCGRLRSSFFSHAAPADPGPPSNATRYLCATAYLEPRFATTVLGELMGSRRAVVPSRGIDLIPVIRHCYKARRQRLIRDILLTFAYLPPLWPLLISALGISFIAGLLAGARWDRRSVPFRVYGIAVGITGVVLTLVFGGAMVLLYGANLYGASASAAKEAFVSWLVLFIAYAIVLFGHGLVQHRTLATWLVPGAAVVPSAAESAQVQARLAEIDAAQHGNLTLYSGEDPFLGTGATPLGWRTADSRVGAGEHAWAIAIEADRAEHAGIDPVRLQEALRSRLLTLDDEKLPPNERVGGLTVDYHVVGEGRVMWNSPLVDPVRMIPYSQVAAEAVTALIRCPQARLRSYLRVSISDEGPMVFAGNQPVIGSVDQDVVVSAFVYVAVEGGMFYLQFVPTALAPVDESFRVVDRMPRPGSGEFQGMVAGNIARTAFFDILDAPFNVYRTLWQMRAESVGARVRADREGAHQDLGARLSVRELGAQPHPRTYIQQLDVSKYTQILERLVLESVLDFLNSEGIDTTAYRARAQAIYNSGVMVGGNVAGSTLKAGTGG